jgi:hypothetical protein
LRKQALLFGKKRQKTFSPGAACWSSATVLRKMGVFLLLFLQKKKRFFVFKKVVEAGLTS